jgi:hypothetical protein
MKKANASAKLKEVFAIPLADTKTPHLILPDRSKSPPTTRLYRLLKIWDIKGL